MSGATARNVWRSRDLFDFRSETDSTSQTSTVQSGEWAMPFNCQWQFWRNEERDHVPKRNIAERVHALFRNGLYTDVKFVINCGKVPKPQLLAHKIILAIGSPVFEEILYGKRRHRSQGEATHMEIEISGTSFEAFSNVVKYLYSDDVYFEDVSLAMETLLAAKKYDVQPLVDRCESFFESSEMTERNVCSLLTLAKQHELTSLKTRCSQFIEENTSNVIRTTEFLHSPLTTVRTTCKLQKFNLRSESELFEAVVRWADAQSRRETRREVIQPLMRNIRILTISLKEFEGLRRKFPDIFLPEEALEIVLFLASSRDSQSTANLPTWCNKGPNRCFAVKVQISIPQKGQALKTSKQKVCILLRVPVEIQPKMSNLTCILEINCLRGSHQFTALKLSFAEPVFSRSYINELLITVLVLPSNYQFTECLTINNSLEVHVKFSKRFLMRAGNTARIRAEARGIEGYTFLQFGGISSINKDSPFLCSVISSSKNQKLYFIREVMYRPHIPNNDLWD